MSKTRAIRFPNSEEEKIEQFLKENPFFDFSTLARMAILAFIENPKLTLKPIKGGKGHRPEKESYGQS